MTVLELVQGFRKKDTRVEDPVLYQNRSEMEGIEGAGWGEWVADSDEDQSEV